MPLAAWRLRGIGDEERVGKVEVCSGEGHGGKVQGSKERATGARGAATKGTRAANGEMTTQGRQLRMARQQTSVGGGTTEYSKCATLGHVFPTRGYDH